MKKNKTFILLTVLLIVLIAGAGFFYNKLSSAYKTDSLRKLLRHRKTKRIPMKKIRKGILSRKKTIKKQKSKKTHRLLTRKSLIPLRTPRQNPTMQKIPIQLPQKRIPVKIPYKQFLILQ